MDIEVVRNELTCWREVDLPSAPLSDGQARLRIDQFGFSSNNVSYAVIGELLRYWEAFPAADADPGDEITWGRVPVWGFAEVVESRSPNVEVRERLFGFLPMATELIITPGKATANEVTDTSPHRAVLASAYNAYRRCAADPVYRSDREDLQMLLYPLYFTSFVIDDFLQDNGDFGAKQVVLSSASAKTSLGAAQLLHARGLTTVALTSHANAEFCRSLGLYDQVMAYDDVASIAKVPSAFIDVSGDQGIVAAVHRHLADRLNHSMIIGDTHWDSPPAEDGSLLPGPPQEFLFAPIQIKKRSREWGPDVLTGRMAAAWAGYADWASGWIRLERVAGPAAVVDTFRAYLAGRVDPRVGTVCTMFPEVATA
jgi:hypothetical protein